MGDGVAVTFLHYLGDVHRCPDLGETSTVGAAPRSVAPFAGAESFSPICGDSGAGRGMAQGGGRHRGWGREGEDKSRNPSSDFSSNTSSPPSSSSSAYFLGDFAQKIPDSKESDLCSLSDQFSVKMVNLGLFPGSKASNSVILIFRIPYYTHWGQHLLVCGSEPALGSWNVKKGLLLRPSHQGDELIWSGSLSVPAEFNCEYSYYVVDDDKNVLRWEAGKKRNLLLPNGVQNGQLVELHDLWQNVDYEASMAAKLSIAKKIYSQEKENVFSSVAFQDFFSENQDWLKPYSAFCFLRDFFETSDHSQWGRFSLFSKDKLEKLVSKDSLHYDIICFHYYIQFHLHMQLSEAASYAREKGVVLKGDLPIGVDRNSVDTWVFPNLFRMNTSTGAPPDYFDKNGQNWGFPTYNWEEMSKDNYAWWRGRLTQDLLALKEKYTTRPAAEETINDPTNPKHYWRYRVHVTVESLLEDKELISSIKGLVHGSGRSCPPSQGDELRLGKSKKDSVKQPAGTGEAHVASQLNGIPKKEEAVTVA
ncbi:4-alpha-glucanotransferase DPE2 [Sesamum angolense]|uniref:4-alpha-glucanotransferase n=1 Tax=Sesamum angolense TaxID=2727404 RepID=A0AAE1WGA0_9LAMI|nr:4-alpha-glucanotransferase DPE2 [Sesamum angolense]